MVLASRPSRSVGGLVTELVRPDPSRSGTARFVLRDHQEDKL
jgi:hypothetical protein